MGKQYLFVCGCPRSGTSGMWSILIASPKVVLGNEWFAGRAHELDPSFYQADRMFQPEIGVDCGYEIRAFPDTRDYVPLAEKRYTTATYVGDKIPYLYRHLDRLADRFPGAKVIYMIRDPFEVASSYKRRAKDSNDPDWQSGGVPEAIKDWNESIEALGRIPEGITVLPVHYRRFYILGESAPVENFLGLKFQDIYKAFAVSIGAIMHSAGSTAKNLTTGDMLRIRGEADLMGYDRLYEAHARVGFGPLGAAPLLSVA